MNTNATGHSVTTELNVNQNSVSMDPRLLYAARKRIRGFLREATASSAPSEISVVAKVTSTSKWESLSEVRNAITIAGRNSKDRTSIVTGRVPLDRIEFIRTQSFVKSLKAAQPMKRTLADGIKETSALPVSLPTGTLSNGGAGVVVGIIDYGCDYAHRNFLDGAGKTRLEAIWHQDGSLDLAGDVPYGREFTKADIDAALAQSDPYSVLGYAPPSDTPYRIGSHGTHVMDIAAGNGNGSGIAGFAPNATLVFVDVAHHDIPFSGPDVIDISFGDSVMLLEAVNYIFGKAGDRPCVINISLGTNGGPHDGSTLVEEGIDRLITAAPNRAVTISASNSYDKGIHASGTVQQGSYVDLIWQVPTHDFSHNELEIWYLAGDVFDVELITPAGDSIGTVPADRHGELVDANGAIHIFISSRIGDPNNGDNMIGIFLNKSVAPGGWTVRLRGQTVVDGRFHAWIERDDRLPSSFAPPHDNSHTIGSISCGNSSIVVGSYDAHKSLKPISYFSSEGPTRDGREKPEISAPGHAVYAAHSRTTNQVVSKSGTSMASPAVAGIVALILAEALGRGRDLVIAEIRNILAKSVNASPPSGSGWDPRYGLGRVDAAKALNEVQQGAALVVPSVSKPKPKRRSKVTA